MNNVLVIGFLVVIFYYLIQFARQEHVQDDFEDAIVDVEGRLEWARTRTFFPFGIKLSLKWPTNFWLTPKVSGKRTNGIELIELLSSLKKL
jgi:hypothetical protein